MKKATKHTINNARYLRSHMTDAEQKLWQQLRRRQIGGLKFRRQHPCGSYILDFACLPIKLAVEVDGGQHMEALHADNQRTIWLKLNGWTVLRFWNHEVLQECEAVLAVINQHVQHMMGQLN